MLDSSPKLSSKTLCTAAADARARLTSLEIGLVAGGVSGEREASLYTASYLRAALLDEGLAFRQLDPADAEFLSAIQEVDIILTALHGRYGEDGKLQGLLETLGKPYTGPGVLASALGMNKRAFKLFLCGLGLTTPPWYSLPSVTSQQALPSSPVVLKSDSEGGSIGVQILSSLHDLETQLTSSGTLSADYFLEHFVEGRLLTVAILEIGGQPYVLPVVEVHLPAAATFYDRNTKIKELASLSLPRLATPLWRSICAASLLAYKQMHCRGCARFDLILDHDNSFHYLEINTIPGMYEGSNFTTAADAAGIDGSSLVVLLLAAALDRSSYQP